MAKISANNISSASIDSTSLDSVVVTNLNTANTANATAASALVTASAAFAAANTNATALANAAPVITSVTITDSSWNALDDTAANTGGGYCVITGSGFVATPTVIFGSNTATAVTYVNSTTLRVQTPVLAATSYHVYVINSTGATAIKLNGLTVSSFPAWGTAATLANVVSNTVFSGTLSANSDSSITYANTTILPTGFTLLANGYYYGNVSVGADTTYTFDVKATDVELQDSTRTFSLTTTLLPPTYTINYLLVAGGGAGGAGVASPGPWGGGGGGGGGLETGTLSVNPGTVFTLTIGAGGSIVGGGPGSDQDGPNGGTTIMASPPFGTASVLGGGGGSRGKGPPSFGFNPGSPGGSGGGGGGANNARSGGSGYPGQGYPGGPNNSGFEGGGGGGAGGAGGINGSPGLGYVWPYTGNTYSSGGTSGNGISTSPGVFGAGGPGNRGSNSNGASGNPGVIIFAIPTEKYPGVSAPGATVTTPPAAPGKTVLTFTNPGTFTA